MCVCGRQSSCQRGSSVPHYDVHVFNLHLRGLGSVSLPPQPYLNLNPAAFLGEQVFSWWQTIIRALIKLAGWKLLGLYWQFDSFAPVWLWPAVDFDIHPFLRRNEFYHCSSLGEKNTLMQIALNVWNCDFHSYKQQFQLLIPVFCQVSYDLTFHGWHSNF